MDDPCACTWATCATCRIVQSQGVMSARVHVPKWMCRCTCVHACASRAPIEQLHARGDSPSTITTTESDLRVSCDRPKTTSDISESQGREGEEGCRGGRGRLSRTSGEEVWEPITHLRVVGTQAIRPHTQRTGDATALCACSECGRPQSVLAYPVQRRL